MEEYGAIIGCALTAKMTIPVEDAYFSVMIDNESGSPELLGFRTTDENGTTSPVSDNPGLRCPDFLCAGLSQWGSEHLVVIQSMLLILSQHFSNLGTLQVTGLHHADSVDMVQRMQTTSELTQPRGCFLYSVFFILVFSHGQIRD